MRRVDGGDRPRRGVSMAIVALVVAASSLAASPVGAQDVRARVARVLKATPLIDGHNDWPEVLREREGDGRWTLDLRNRPGTGDELYNTDITRLRQGMVGGQFWSVWVSPNLPGPEQVKETIEQIALVQSFVERYPESFAMARTAADVRRIHKSGRIASLIGVEGGGQIDGSLGVLRAYRALGASYLTLTHSRNVEWADSATDDPKHDGLTEFGESVVRELNRLGMLVDLSHVSEATMLDALRVSKAPVMFSHSNARALVDHPRNVSDLALKQVAANNGRGNGELRAHLHFRCIQTLVIGPRRGEDTAQRTAIRRALSSGSRSARRLRWLFGSASIRSPASRSRWSPIISSTSRRLRASIMSASARTSTA